LFPVDVSPFLVDPKRTHRFATVAAAVGGLSMQRLGLNVTIYDPQVHYQQVRDAWIGVRIPDGR
jgi:hypothetical protein